jgi:hypothetical protein
MRAKHGFAPLGPATGRVKSAIFGETSARLYGIKAAAYADLRDRLILAKEEYRRSGAAPSNLRYGYVARG